MTDREKLVRLIDESAYIKMAFPEGQISYYLDSEKIADHLLAHGVTVKEPQKPLTVEEASGTNEPVWMEYITGRVFVCDLVASPGWNGIYDAYVIGGAVPKPLPKNHYGKSWRCWAEKPTEEERKNAKWEE